MEKKKIINAFNRINENVEVFSTAKENKKKKDDIKINRKELQLEWDEALVNAYFINQPYDNVGQIYSKFLKNKELTHKMLTEQNIKIERTPKLNAEKFAYPKRFVHLFLPKLEEILKETSDVELILEQIQKENMKIKAVKLPTPIKSNSNSKLHKKSSLDNTGLNGYINEIVEQVNQHEYVAPKFKN